MSPDLALVSEGKKFLWDGRLYESGAESARAREAYLNDGFEVRTVEQEGKFLVYTRRAVKQTVATQ